MPKSINLTGTPGKEYNLETLANSNTRGDSSKELLVQIWYWNPDGITFYSNNPELFEQHKSPNPPNVKLGQMWLSKLVSADFVVEEA